uniref:(S)-ureidoglycine aminohydrolase cupin domain-containing protein n=1 Tax=Lotharella oceanica TaxID=641309 RepID=A0A7S2X5W6_9EUKA|mmetsp:Transcript_1060/g.2000  ORF Transcript_1060/g.2000 Transcript_1060/m.2000 type:complete len:318 (+) Transcript_1060:32-985(+)
MAEVFESVGVVAAKDIVIKEFFGRVGSRDAKLSACEVKIHSATQEAWQKPEFDEYVLVLEGSVELQMSDGKKVSVSAGEGVFLPKGLRVKWVWPGPCRYIPICLPAFSPENCGREEEEGNAHAKDGKAMRRLRELHAETLHPFLFHVAKKSLWEEAKRSGSVYYPPTYKKDGNFTHATADPTKLVDVLNHFYKDVEEEYVCLRMTSKTLRAAGVDVTFEETAPVGDTPAIDMGDQLFPHIQGGIPSSKVVTEELNVLRAKDGTFLDIPGIFGDAHNGNGVIAKSGAMKNYIIASVVGLGAGFLLGCAWTAKLKNRYM